MLTFRLRRVQVELQSHRKWLKTFHAGSVDHHGRAEAASSTSRSFSSSHGYTYRYGQTQDPAPAPEQTRYVSPAKQRKQERKINRQLGRSQSHSKERTVNLGALATRSELFEAVDRTDIVGVMSAYHRLPEKKPLSSDDFYKVAQCAHQALRLENQKPPHTKRREETEQIVAFAELLARDIGRGDLVPSTAAHVHLMGLFKESGAKDAGLKFWNWLQTQDWSDEHVSAEVYAVAVDFLAVNGFPLEDLEDLYQRALVRFPGSFNAYHLSPEAIVSDREKAISIKGIPMALLQSIILARLLRGESQKAYLGLDTALRLFPTAIPQRALRTFLDERPISESYTVFAMVYRAGMHLPGLPFKAFLSKLRTTADSRSAASHFCSVRAMLSIMYLHLGASGSLASNTVGELVIAMTQILRLPEFDAMERKQRGEVVDSVLEIVRKTWAVFARYGAVPTLSSFNSVIANVACYGRLKSVVGIVLADMKALGLEPNDITRRSIMKVGTVVHDKEFVTKAWKTIVDARAAKDQRPDLIDLNVFIKAARLSDMSDFAAQEAQKYRFYLPKNSQSSVDYYLTKPLEGASQIQKVEGYAEDVVEGLAKLRADLDVLDERTRENPRVQDFSNQTLPTMLVKPPVVLAIDDQAMRAIYDEFTTEPVTRTTEISAEEPSNAENTQDATEDIALPRSATNLTFGTLRYESWKCVNSLLWLAEKHDKEYEAAVDEAIAAGTKPPTREMGLGKAEQDELDSFGLSDSTDSNVTPQKSDAAAVEAARKEIARLRGRLAV
ncbi:uncharacterized protein RCC_00147 [Ramularia collo-cygni]|uniref:Pentatricopeptide repeat protein n=1 Tax=Ramularia collo-cygni TaxID=112498 RepID=A0A2D3V1R2_9PEZI|nr:uncharacterized protein RCC_00147 [Ramularia collo-cygni]CZT14173.1 uncharacterized protein RCC_00147 [Ramularia collo-cygni]